MFKKLFKKIGKGFKEIGKGLQKFFTSKIGRILGTVMLVASMASLATKSEPLIAISPIFRVISLPFRRWSIFSAFISPEIYLPIVGFFIILILAFFIKKIYFKK